MTTKLRVAAISACCSTLTAAALAGPAAAITSAVRVDTLKALKHMLPRVQDATGVPIRLPRVIYFSTPGKLYDTGDGSTDAYDLELAFAPRCGSATACFAASFTGRRGAKAVGRQSVRLAKGVAGRFTPTACGASCSPPQIQWIQNGVRYTVQLFGGQASSEKETLVSYADSAITQPRL